MRVISGILKGKKLTLPKNKKTRPLKDLVKESIFNIINHSSLINIEVKNSNILDLFSGIGSFGIECISRGAKKVTFVENDLDAIKILKKNLNRIHNFQLIQNDCFKLLENKNLIEKFNIIFIDPPYKEHKINEIIEEILNQKLLNNNGLVIIHRHRKDNLKITGKLNIFLERNYGLSKIYFGS